MSEEYPRCPNCGIGNSSKGFRSCWACGQDYESPHLLKDRSTLADEEVTIESLRTELARMKAERDEARAVMLSCLEVLSEDGSASGMMRVRCRLDAALARKEGAR